MPPKLRSKTTVESSKPGSNAAKAAQEGRVLALVGHIENLINSSVRQQGNPSNNPIEQVEGRGVGNVDVLILFFNNSNEFKAFMQEIKSERVVMIAIMEEMKYFRERKQTRQEVASKPERQFCNELRVSIMITYGELVNFTAYLCRQRLDTFLPIGKREVL